MSVEISNEIDTAVVMAAGMGTRGLPLTKVLPKEMSEVYGRPLIDWVAEELAEVQGVENLVIVISDEKDANGQNYQETLLRRWFDPNKRYEEYLIANGKMDLIDKLDNAHGLNFEYVVQPSDGRYGTAVSLWAARAALQGVERFFVVNGDDMCEPSDVSPFRQLVANTTLGFAPHGMMVKEVPAQQDGKYPYGIVQIDQAGRLVEIVEKPEAESFHGIPYANMGKFLFSASVMDHLDSYMQGPRDARSQDEFYLIDVVNSLADKKEVVQVYPTDSEFIDAGDAKLRLLASMTLAGLPSTLIEEARQHFHSGPKP